MKTKKIWQSTKYLLLLLVLISTSFLLANWWNKYSQQPTNQELASKLEKLTQLEQKVKAIRQQHQLQKNYCELTANLANNPKIHTFFSDLLRTYAEKFASRKKLDIYHYPLNFGGFYQQEQSKLGSCCFTPANQHTVINLNQIYLLNKLKVDCSYLAVDFTDLLQTCSHELAHYFQFVKHEKSSCESDLVLNNSDYD
jgi:hypothetical protein